MATEKQQPAAEAARAAHVRGMNLERLFGVAMAQDGRFTRAELIAATSLSAPTVGALSSALIERGLLRDLGIGPSSGGRRPSFMEFNARHSYVAAIDIGAASTRLAVADLRGEPVARRTLPTPTAQRPLAMLRSLTAELRTLLKDEGVPLDKVRVAAVGVPGAVDRENGVVVALAPNLKGWSRVPVGATLKKALGVPVVVENDVNLAILAERWRGAAQGHDTCAYVTLGTGIGAGIIVDGALHHGHHYLAGEIGIMCMGPQFVEDDFGTRGCLETLAGLKSVGARWHAVGGSNGNGAGELGALFAAARGGDPQAARILKETFTLIGMAVANLSVVIDPSLVVLGGALASQDGALLDEVRRIVSRIIPAPSAIVTSELGEEAPLWGAILVAQEEAARRIRRQLRMARG